MGGSRRTRGVARSARTSHGQPGTPTWSTARATTATPLRRPRLGLPSRPRHRASTPTPTSRRPGMATTATATLVTTDPRRRTPVTLSLVTRPPRRQGRQSCQRRQGTDTAGLGTPRPRPRLRWRPDRAGVPRPAPQDYQGPDAYQAESRWQAWDYDQPLRYDDERRSHPGQDSHGPQPGEYRGPDGYGPDAYHAAPVYDPAGYNGSDYSRPGIDGPGYDLTGIIGTGDFEAFGYDEPSYDRLSYDDPRYDDGPRGGGYPGPHPGGGPRLDETRMDMRALGAARSDETRFDVPRFDVPRFDETRLDSLWLSDEDVRHEPVGYENDGFGGDAPGRSGFSAFGAPGGGPRLNETRMDLRALGTPRSDETRFDVPAYDAYDETRIDGMRAMGPRASATGLLAPPDDRPRSWAEETSFDDFSDYGVLDDEPVRAPAAFVRTAERPDHLERPDDTATRRAIGRRRGRSGDRRQWMALGAIAVVAAGAIGGVLVKFMHSGPGGPAHTVVAPNQADGFTRSANLEKQMKVDSLSQSVMQSSSGQASNLVSAVYEQGNAAAGANAQIFMFVGGKLARCLAERVRR